MKESSGISNHKPSLDEMWKFIEGLMRPSEIVLDRSIFTYDQVFVIYSKLADIDEMLKEIAQISILRKELNKEKSQETVV
ncbi:MAG TPA: hypothetical protein VFJ23_02480 [Candidatus Nitrosotalea sp.]|nr:hypothetical protein [Candidatus Nitrosotalea sp.]